MTRLAVLPVALLVGLVSSCGTRQAPADGSPTSAAPSRSTAPVERPDRPREVVLGGIPLADGLPATDGEGAPVPVTKTPGVPDLVFCETPAWTAPANDVAGVRYAGEAEDSRARTLAVYDDARAADAALDDVRRGVSACPLEPYGGTDQVLDVVSDETDDDGGTLVVTHRYRTGGAFDTGIEVLQLVQIGRALLVTSDYAEAGGSPATIASFVELTAESTGGVVAAMTTRFAVGAEPAPDPVDSVDEIPADFPLGAGMPTPASSSHPDDGLAGPSDVRPDDTGLPACGRSLAGGNTVDRSHAAFRDIEYTRTRDLLAFADLDAAVGFVASARDLYEACPKELATGDMRDYSAEWRVAPIAVGGESFAALHHRLFQGYPMPGLDVVQLVRVGRAVLVETESSEAGASPDPAAERRRILSTLETESADVVAAMCAFTDAGCP